MQVNPGTWYVVTTDSECTVTDANGKTLCTAVAGEQKPFLATTMQVTLSDEGATVTKTTFKRAALALGLFGGGVTSSLPAGYTRLEFLESTGTQYIDTGRKIDQGSALTVECEITPSRLTSSHSVFGYTKGENVPDRVAWAEYPHAIKGWVFWGWTSAEVLMQTAPTERHRVDLSRFGLYYNGIEQRKVNSGDFQTSGTCWLFARNRPDMAVTQYAGKIYSFIFSQNGSPQLNFVPFVDDKGEPCMFDIVTRRPFYNSGSGAFIAGFTLAQARKLGKLPANTTLTISLPVGWQEDDGVVEALAQAEANGCVLTYQEYDTVASAAATYALRRIWVKRTQDDKGSYVDANNTRWLVEWCVDVIGADPETLGYERFRSVEAATEYWELTPYQYPEDENLITETE